VGGAKIYKRLGVGKMNAVVCVTNNYLDYCYIALTASAVAQYGFH
jgi:hypothetical protein